MSWWCGQVYCYCTETYMVTFERELITQPDEDDAGSRLASTYRSPLSFDDYDEPAPASLPFGPSGGRSGSRHHSKGKRRRGASVGGGHCALHDDH